MATQTVQAATVASRQSKYRKSAGVSVWRLIRRWPVAPMVVLIALLVSGLFSPWVAPQDPEFQTLAARLAEPSIWGSDWYDEHPRVEERYLFGADHVGRDVLSRVIFGSRISLLVIATSLPAGVIVGTGLGLIAGYVGGKVDEVIMRLWDIWAAIPFLLVALVIATVAGSGLWLVIGILALASWSAFVRNVRAETLALRDRDFVYQARIMGASPVRVMVRHILPNLINTVVVIATLRVGGLILAEASLSFLGIGIPKSTPTWGNMISDGRGFLDDGWWISLFPGLALFLVVMSFNFTGDWLRDRWDPRLRQLD